MTRLQCEQRTANSEQRTANSHNSDLKILICYHKPYTTPPLDDGILLPIQGGKAISDDDFHMQGDNELNGQPCDNISSKNAQYNEMTAVYWAWKNLKKLYPDVKYVGLCHYRRFFAFHERKLFGTYIYAPESAIQDYRADAVKVREILESGRVIFAKRFTFPYSVYVQYAVCHASWDYRTLREVIKEKFPDYYEAFIDSMENSNKFLPCNMFIMKYDDFTKYCEWHFAVMAELEKHVNYSSYPTYQKRIFAFIAERLMNVYMTKHNVKPAYLNVYFYNGDGNLGGRLDNFPGFLRDSLRLLRRMVSYFKRELIFRLGISRFGGRSW
ncbi:MAG: DUF4422 domain-containing protein [Synergistaceae bacterium]|nr:DUF4422 domain-containing protein [Synergistaceae bacterium]